MSVRRAEPQRTTHNLIAEVVVLPIVRVAGALLGRPGVVEDEERRHRSESVPLRVREEEEGAVPPPALEVVGGGAGGDGPNNFPVEEVIAYTYDPATIYPDGYVILAMLHSTHPAQLKTSILR